MQPYLFPNSKIEITPKQMAKSAQFFYENICGLVLSHYKHLKLTYKNLLKEYRNHYSKEELAAVSKKFKRIHLDDNLFVRYESDEENESDSESETDQSDTS